MALIFGRLSGTFLRPEPQVVSQKYCTTKWEAYCRTTKSEAYCSTNRRCIAGFPSLQGVEARKMQRCNWGAYCRSNWRCTAVLWDKLCSLGAPKHCPGWAIFRREGVKGQNRRTWNGDVGRGCSLFQNHFSVPFICAFPSPFLFVS